MEKEPLLSKWLNEEMNSDELKYFEQHPDYDLFVKIKETSARLKTPEFDENTLLNAIKQQTKITSKKPKVFALNQKIWLRIAAVFVLTLGLVYSYQMSFTTLVAPNSESLVLLLPDESEVVLQKNATISYQKWFWNQKRTLTLKGEAFFKVKKGEKFEVQTALGEVAVLGTQFLVSDANQTLNVKCFEGVVSVTQKDEKRILKRGDAVVFDVNQNIIESKISDNIPQWILSSLEFQFDNANLSNIISDLSQHYNIQIEASSELLDKKFTGKLPKNNLNVALEIISVTYNMEVVKLNATKFKLNSKK